MFCAFVRSCRIADTFATSAARKFLYHTVASGLVKISAILYSVLMYKILISPISTLPHKTCNEDPYAWCDREFALFSNLI